MKNMIFKKNGVSSIFCRLTLLAFAVQTSAGLVNVPGEWDRIPPADVDPKLADVPDPRPRKWSGQKASLRFSKVFAEDGSIRVRLRSRFVHINSVAEKHNGGGHACAAGATLYSADEMAALIADADARLKEYKENNEGWL